MPSFLSHPRNLEDAVLVQKAGQGDAAAWAEIVERHGRLVMAILRAYRVPERDQADAFQHVFVELFKSLANLKEEARLAPWLRMTTQRHAVKLREKLARAEPTDVETAFYDLESSDDVEGALMAAENAGLVRQAVDGLQDRCRELVTALFFEDPPRPYVEVAEQLGLKPGSMGMTRQRCLEALEKALRARGLP